MCHPSSLSGRLGKMSEALVWAEECNPLCCLGSHTEAKKQMGSEIPLPIPV